MVYQICRIRIKPNFILRDILIPMPGMMRGGAATVGAVPAPEVLGYGISFLLIRRLYVGQAIAAAGMLTADDFSAAGKSRPRSRPTPSPLIPLIRRPFPMPAAS